MTCFNDINLWVYRNLSRHATWHQSQNNMIASLQRDKVISNCIKARKSKSTEQYDCKLFFRLADGTCNSMVELSNSTGWEFDSPIKFNASTGEEHCEWWFVCGVCGTEVPFDIKHVGFTVSSFFSRDQQAAIGSLLRMELILANTSLLLNTLRKKWTHEVGLDRYLGTSTRESHNRAAKHIKISCLSRESSLNHSWPSWILPQAISDIQIYRVLYF